MTAKLKKVACPWCNGFGGHTEPVLEYGDGPYETCDMCKGEGVLKKGKFYYQVLGWMSGLKRQNDRIKAIERTIYV